MDSFSVDPIEVKDQMIGHDPGSGKPFGVISKPFGQGQT